MPAEPSPFFELVRAELSAIGDVSVRAMFGGHGVYWRDVFFAIVFRGRLYFKVDDESRPDYLARGMPPFRPSEDRTMKSYHEVPAEVVADPEALRSWAKEAIRAALAKSSR